MLGQIVAALPAKGKTRTSISFEITFGHEVDFLMPVGEKMVLLECKWSETPPKKFRGISEIAKLVGPENVLSQSIITPVRGTRGRPRKRIFREDCVDLPSLDG